MRCLFLLLFSVLCIQQGALASDILTPTERRWLDEHDGKIIFASDPSYPPLSFFDANGQYRGYSADYTRLLEKKLGFRFRKRRFETWSDILDAAKERRVDVVDTIQQTPERGNYLLFTSPYVEAAAVILTNDRIQRSLTLGSLQGLKVASVRSYAINNYLQKLYPELPLIFVPDNLTGLRKLAIGEFDAMLVDFPSAAYLIQKEGIHGLRVAGETGYRYEYSYGSRKDWPILNTILEKGRNSITEEEQKALFDKWINLKALEPYDIRALFFFLGIALFLGISGIGWIVLLRQQVRARTKDLEEELIERKRIEEALKEKERNYRDIFNSTDDALFIQDTDTGDIITANKGAVSMFGYAQEEIKKLGIPGLSEPSVETSPERVRQRNQEALEKGSITFEWHFRKKNGQPFWAEVKLNRTVINGREQILSVIRDITVRKRAESEREKLLLQQRQIDALKEADLLKDQFLGIVSHELRSPLNAITGFGSMLDDEVFGPLTPKQHEYLAKVLASSDNLLFLVNDLLDMSRIQAGKFSISPQWSSFSEIVAQAIESVQPAADQKREGLLVELSADLPPLWADPQRIAQVLVNLLNNAIKFTPEGGKIRLKATRQGDFIRCEVTDNGIGIAPEEQSKLFIPFSQLEARLARKTIGAGLGLSISKAIVESHGGQIGVTSSLGKGSTFWFLLPLKSKD